MISLFPFCGFASEDTPSPVTFVHTRYSLPAPWRTGEIIARADYLGERHTARLHSLTIIVSKDVIKVPKRIRDFFPAMNLGSFELLYGPPPERGSHDRRYVEVNFRFFCLPYWGTFLTESRPHIGRLLIEAGRIKSVSKIEEESDTVTIDTSYDPKTLKETGKVAFTLH